MSYQRFIVCVDISGSMCDNNKLQTAKNTVKQLRETFNCTTNYYYFNTSVGAVGSAQEFDNLQVSGGTRIEAALNDLFNNKLKQYKNYGDKTKFVFVTDAEDSINDVNGCITAKQQCIRAYQQSGGQLSCVCKLVGSGGCSAALNRIFGHNFHNVSSQNFGSAMNTYTRNMTAVNNAGHQSTQNSQQIPRIQNVQTELEQEGNEQFDEMQQNLQRIENRLNANNQNVESIRNDLNDLGNERDAVINRANSATTTDEIERAEEDTEGVRDRYEDQRRNINAAGRELTDIEKELKNESDRASQLSQSLGSKNNRICRDASNVVNSIKQTISKLSQIKNAAWDEIKELKSEFREQITNLMNIVQNQEDLADQFTLRRTEIKSTFNEARRKLKEERFELDDFKRKITSNVKQLNDVLKMLDERY